MYPAGYADRLCRPQLLYLLYTYAHFMGKCDAVLGSRDAISFSTAKYSIRARFIEHRDRMNFVRETIITIDHPVIHILYADHAWRFRRVSDNQNLE